MIDVTIPLKEYSIDDTGVHVSDTISRSFIIFGEELPLFITSVDPLKHLFHSLAINLKDSLIRIDKNADSLIKHNDHVWQLDPTFIRKTVFNSDYLVNNVGQQGRISFQFFYLEPPLKTNEQALGSNGNESDILPSFQPLTASPPGSAESTDSVHRELKSKTVELPIYSLMNMRLRNIAIRPERNSTTSQVISSLDIQLARKFEELFPEEPYLTVDSLCYELCDGNFKLPLQPMEEMIEFPLNMKRHDAYTINYQLQDSTRLIKVTIIYKIGSSYKIRTSWETEVCLGKPTPSKSIVSSNTSTPTFIQPPSVQLPRVLAQAHFNFLQSKITVKKGEPFKVTLQVENTTPRVLNLVVYHRPKSPLAQTLILITNDLKLPLLSPGTTFQCDLEIIAIAKGYHHNTKGIKIVDLEALDVVDLGSSLSILVE